LLLTVILSFEIFILFYQGWPLRLWRAAVQPVGSGGGHTTLAELAVVRRLARPTQRGWVRPQPPGTRRSQSSLSSAAAARHTWWLLYIW